ncbi:MAG: discoidin domain-containing protein, partial [Pirellulales bacterium]
FHSAFVDLILTGLVGIVRGDDDSLVLHPLAPEDWDYFAVDDVPYRGRKLAVAWDKRGDRYGMGAGLHVLIDGKKIHTSTKLDRVSVRLPAQAPAPAKKARLANYAVNNDKNEFPRITASFTAANTSAAKLIDGNFWYHISPPNRWTAAGSPNASDSVEIDFGATRRIDTVKVYVLDDSRDIVPPAKIAIETWDGAAWGDIKDATARPEKPTGRRANVFHFPERATSRLRVVLTHGAGKTGLTEIEAWGEPEIIDRDSTQ